MYICMYTHTSNKYRNSTENSTKPLTECTAVKDIMCIVPEIKCSDISIIL